MVEQMGLLLYFLLIGKICLVFVGYFDLVNLSHFLVIFPYLDKNGILAKICMGITYNYQLWTVAMKLGALLLVKIVVGSDEKNKKTKKILRKKKRVCESCNCNFCLTRTLVLYMGKDTRSRLIILIS